MKTSKQRRREFQFAAKATTGNLHIGDIGWCRANGDFITKRTSEILRRQVAAVAMAKRDEFSRKNRFDLARSGKILTGQITLP